MEFILGFRNVGSESCVTLAYHGATALFVSCLMPCHQITDMQWAFYHTLASKGQRKY